RAGERVVAVDAHGLVARLDHRHQQRAALALRMELHAGLDLVHALEQLARHVLDQRRVVLAVAFLGLDVDLDRVASLLAGQRLLQARDDVAGAVEVAQRLALRRLVDDIAVVVGEGVVDAGDARVGDLHGESPGRNEGRWWHWTGIGVPTMRKEPPRHDNDCTVRAQTRGVMQLRPFSRASWRAYARTRPRAGRPRGRSARRNRP